MRLRLLVPLLVVAGVLVLGVPASIANGGTGTVTLESVDASGTPIDSVLGASTTDDGKVMAFESTDSNLVSPAPPAGTAQSYVKSLVTGHVTLVSTTAAGVPENGTARYGVEPAISRNGHFVAFQTVATNLDPRDTDGVTDIYVKNLATGALTLASTNSAGVKGNDESYLFAVSDDGTRVLFETRSTNIDPRHTRKTCSYVDDGQVISYDCTHTELYVKNLATGATTLLTAGDAGTGYGALGAGLSADGRDVVFATYDALSPDDADGPLLDVYETDLLTGVTTLVSTDQPSGTADSASVFAHTPSVSADGTRVAFQAYAPGWPPYNTNGTYEVYVRDLATGTLTLESTTPSGVPANDMAQDVAISGDGTYLVFHTNATNLDPADTDASDDTYLKNIDTGALRLVSQRDDGTKGNVYSLNGRAADGGGSVVFVSSSTNLVDPPTTASYDVFLKEFPLPAPPAFTSASSTTAGLRTPFDFKVVTAGTPAPTITGSGALPAGVTLIDNGDGTADLAGTAAIGSAASYPITFTATNDSGSVTQPFVLHVSSAPSVPGFMAPAADTETFGVPFSYTVNTTGYPVPKLTKSGALPAGVTFTANADGTATIAGTAAKAAAGAYPLTLTAKSSAGTASETFTLTITRAPTINRVAATVNVVVGTPMTPLTITARGYERPVLGLAGALPSGLTFTDNGDGTATLAGTADGVSNVGAQTLTVTAQNQYGSASQTFVLDANVRPAITSPTSASATIGAAFSFHVTATGFPAPKLSRVGALPKGITWDASTATFSGTAKARSAGSYPVTITAKNKVATVTQTFTIVVA